MGNSKELGAWGESRGAVFLTRQGYEILERNYHARYGEIDIIALDGDYLVFVEVRLRSSGTHGRPEETVDRRKQEKLRRTAEAYLQEHPTDRQPRFDVLAIYAVDGMDTNPLPIRHIKNAF